MESSSGNSTVLDSRNPVLLPPASPLSSFVAFIIITLTLICWKVQGCWASVPASQATSEDTSPTNEITHASLFTLLRHVIAYTFGRVNAVGFIHGLGNSAPTPILTINFPRGGVKLHVSKPSIEPTLARNYKSLSPASFCSWAFHKYIFGLSDRAVREIQGYDTQGVFHKHFIVPEKGKVIMRKAMEFLTQMFDPDYMERQGGTSKNVVAVVELNKLIFDLTAGTTALTIWGVSNPYFAKQQDLSSGGDGGGHRWKPTKIWDDFYQFQLCFQDLYRPLPSITARKAWTLKRDLMEGMKGWHIEQQRYAQARRHTQQDADNTKAMVMNKDGILPDNIHHNIISLIPNQVNPENWIHDDDYYAVQVVSCLALLSTIGNIGVWLVRYLLADEDLLARVTAEVEGLVDRGDDGIGGRADLANVRKTCPWLLAAWYEVLRLHMTGIPREVVKPFTLGTNAEEEMEKGDVIFLPMTEFNRHPEIWHRPGEFLPERFIIHEERDGTVTVRVNAALTRKAKGFGVAGNLCPGRYHAFGIVMGVVVGLLVTSEVSLVDIEGAGKKEGGWKRPVASKGLSADGLEKVADDGVLVELVRKKEWIGKRLEFDFSTGFFRN